MNFEDAQNIQILNISNVNAQGRTVLNDGKLLDLIQCFPFLYNPRVRPYNDPDYTDWAWKRINAAFNKSYEDDPQAAFSTRDLQSRWNVLKPIIQCLSKAYDLNAIPKSLSRSVVKISVQLDDQTTDGRRKPYTTSQNLLLKYMPKIAGLPLEQRLALERDMLDLILTEELDTKGTVKLGDGEQKWVTEECEEFLRNIEFDQVITIAKDLHDQPRGGNALKRPAQPSKDTNATAVSLDSHPLEVSKGNRQRSVTGRRAEGNVRKCMVRLKRVNVEDHTPLSKIRRRGSRLQ